MEKVLIRLGFRFLLCETGNNIIPLIEILRRLSKIVTD